MRAKRVFYSRDKEYGPSDLSFLQWDGIKLLLLSTRQISGGDDCAIIYSLVGLIRKISIPWK